MFSDADMTARSKIRDCALTMFAERGPDAVTVRDIAACASVSPALVLHHFGSKQGLREAVDQHVAGLFDALFDGANDLGEIARGGEPAAASFAEMLMSRVPANSPIPAYLRRLLLSGDEAGRHLFRQWYRMSLGIVQMLEATGGMHRSADPEMRAAFLLVNDLAMVLLHDHIADVLGNDPLAPDGIGRWATDAMDAYTRGVFDASAQPDPDPDPDPSTPSKGDHA